VFRGDAPELMAIGKKGNHIDITADVVEAK
jgi:hypothetical protein